MKFDLNPQIVDGILAVLQEAPVPHKIVNPLVQELIRQVKDEKIQSLVYPDQKPAPATEAAPAPATEAAKRKRGRPTKSQANGQAGEAHASM